MIKHCLLLSAVLALLASSNVCAGEIYTWKDAEGHVHYSDVPPPGSGDVKKLKSSTAASQAAEAPAQGGRATSSKTVAERELDFRRRRAEAQEAKDKADKDQAGSTQRRQECETARNQLRALESGQRASRFNDKGEAIPLDDDQRQIEVERSRQYLDKNCR